MSEANDLTKRLLVTIPREFPGSRVWRQNVGAGYPVDPIRSAMGMMAGGRIKEAMALIRKTRPVTFGVPGQPDIDGWLHLAGLAVRLGVEVKVGLDVQNREQLVAERVYTEAGAVYVVARDLDQAIAEIRKRKQEVEGCLRRALLGISIAHAGSTS